MANGAFVAWLTSPAPPVWAAVIAAAVMVVRSYPAWKQRWTEARTADDAIVGNQWTRLTAEIARQDERLKKLEVAEEKCREELANTKSRLAELEGYAVGQGSARQEMQGIVSAERLIDDAAKPRKP